MGPPLLFFQFSDPKAHVPHPFLMKNGHQEWRASSFQHSVKRIKLHGRCLGNAHPLDYKQMVSSLVENPRNWKPWQFWLYRKCLFHLCIACFALILLCFFSSSFGGKCGNVDRKGNHQARTTSYGNFHIHHRLPLVNGF